MAHPSSTFKYIDLFAGCGGLSLGLEQAGGELVCAVERSPMAAETFRHNLVKRIESPDEWPAYLGMDFRSQIAQQVLVAEVGRLLELPDTLVEFRDLDVDLIAGGPPCQGFSLAGRRNPQDSRNALPWQFLEVVSKVAPKIVVIENVVGMRHKFEPGDSHSTYDALSIALSETQVITPTGPANYLVQKIQANAMHYGAAQTRPRLLLVGLRTDIAQAKGISISEEIWHSDFADKSVDAPALAPKPIALSYNPALVRDALADQLKGKKSDYLDLLNDSDFWGLSNRNGTFNTGLRTHNESSVTRFGLYLLASRHGLPAILLKEVDGVDFQEKRNAALASLERLTYPIDLPGTGRKVKNAKELRELFNVFKTRKHSQRVVELDKPAPTIVTAADDYIHPLEPRVFSVRELARFQGFPEFFEFRAKETTGGLKRRTEVPQYSQVGNAVSPFLGIAIGKMIREVLS